MVYRFASAAELRAWLDSTEHTTWVERAEPHAIGPTRSGFRTGLESWFTLPSDPGLPPPPPYKMALLTWLTIFPLISLVIVVLGPHLRGLALLPRLAITTAVTVPLMTWIVMPIVTKLLRRWLLRYAAHRSGRRLRATRVPLARLRLALSRLWLAYPPRLSRRARPAISLS